MNGVNGRTNKPGSRVSSTRASDSTAMRVTVQTRDWRRAASRSVFNRSVREIRHFMPASRGVNEWNRPSSISGERWRCMTCGNFDQNRPHRITATRLFGERFQAKLCLWLSQLSARRRTRAARVSRHWHDVLTCLPGRFARFSRAFSLVGVDLCQARYTSFERERWRQILLENRANTMPNSRSGIVLVPTNSVDSTHFIPYPKTQCRCRFPR